LADATGDIDEGTIIFTEDDMPDCSLHRSSNPNCALVEIDEGAQAIVSIRPIKLGEFFCVANSDDEASEDDSEDDNEENVVDED
jgi:U3 small nucleolar RNA-associated protein 6